MDPYSVCAGETAPAPLPVEINFCDANFCAPAGSTISFPPPSSSPPPTFIVTSGNCVTDAHCVQHASYPASYGVNEACSIKVSGTTNITLSAERFDVQPMSSMYWWSYGGGWWYEGCADYLLIDGVYYCGTSSPQGLSLPPGSTLQWASDWSINATGWRICGNSSSPAAGGLSPPAASPPPVAETCTETCTYASDGDCDDGGPGA
eukprot:1574303-Prymnesium_polylepis.1